MALVLPALSYRKLNYFLYLWLTLSSIPTVSLVKFPLGVQLQNQALLEIKNLYWILAFLEQAFSLTYEKF